MPRFLSALTLAACCALLTTPVASAAPPPNDDLAEREVLSGPLPIEVSRSNVEATREEPNEFVAAFAAGHSIWFEWEATGSGWVTIGSCDSGIDTVLGIFAEAEAGFLVKQVDGNDSEGPHCWARQSEYTFEATSGTKYLIAVDGNGFSPPGAPRPVTEGQISLRIESTPPPANDAFANATPISGSIDVEPAGGRSYLARASGFNWTATEEPGEPAPVGSSGGHSVWYRWTPPESGLARVSLCCAPLLLRMYAGGSLGALAPLELGAPGFLQASVTGGRTYMLAVDAGRDEATGEPRPAFFSMIVSMRLSPRSAVPVVPAVADTQPPRTKLLRKQVLLRKRSARFFFKASEPATFRCKLDRRRLARCRSPKTYKGLKPGLHTFRVFAVDAAGNRDRSAAKVRFRIAKPRKAHGRKG